MASDNETSEQYWTAMRAARRGSFRVMRNCCTSGNCFECRGVTPYGKPLRIVQADGYSEAYAARVAQNWSLYKATVERMPLN